MSYDANESSVEGGQPVECYEFIGTHNTYRFTTADTDIVLDSKVFRRAVSGRSKLVISGQQDINQELIVYLPYDHALVYEYAYKNAPPDLQLIVYRGHRTDNLTTDFVIYSKGKVSGISVDGEEASFRVPSLFSNAMTSAASAVYFQSSCNHTLYDGMCRVLRNSFRVETSVATVDSLSVSLASAGGHPDGFFVGGEVYSPSSRERRTIVAHTGTTLTISFPFSMLDVGMLVEVTAGCNHSQSDCKNKFNNIARYGGDPLIPTSNAFVEGF